MNTGNQPLLVMQSDCNSAVSLVTTTLRSAGCQVLRSFDLHSAMEAHAGCACNPVSCDCQMIVLLVYEREGPPDSLIFDSHRSQTLVYLARNTTQSTHPGWIGKIAQLLSNPISTVNPITPCNE